MKKDNVFEEIVKIEKEEFEKAIGRSIFFALSPSNEQSLSNIKSNSHCCEFSKLVENSSTDPNVQSNVEQVAS